MIKIWQSVFVGLAAMTLGLLTAVPASAAAGAGFQVSPVLPENQREGAGGYFDLVTAPGQTQELAIEVINTDEEELIVEVEAVTASTNMNGVINYTTAGEYDSSLPHSLAELLDIAEPVVTIPGNSTTTITVTLTSPEEEYTGYLLGGINIKKRLSEEERDSGQMILNQYSYVVAVKLAQNDEVIDNDFSLRSIGAELVNGQAAVIARIVNPRPVLVRGMETRVEIFPEAGMEAIMTHAMENIEMAPNSVLPFTLTDDSGQRLEAGAYVAVIEIAYNDQRWNFSEVFEISDETAGDIYSGVAEHPGGVPFGVIIAVIVAITLAVVVIWRRNRN